MGYSTSDLIDFFRSRYVEWRANGTAFHELEYKWRKDASNMIKFIDLETYRRSWDEVDPIGFSVVTGFP